MRGIDDVSFDGTYPSISALQAYVELVDVVGVSGLMKSLDTHAQHSRQAIEKHWGILEEHYGGVPLLQKNERGRYKVTEEGKLLYAYARQALRAHDRVKRWPPGEASVGRAVNIGSGNAVMRYFLPQYTTRLMEDSGTASLSVRVVESNSREKLLRNLRFGKTHLGIEGIPASGRRGKPRPSRSPFRELDRQVLSDEFFYSTIAVGNKRVLPQSYSPLTLADLAGPSQTVPLYFVAGEEVRLLRHLRSLKTWQPRKIGIMSTLDGVLACVRQGKGIGFVSSFLEEEAMKPKGALVVRKLDSELEGLFERLYLGVWWRKDDIRRRKNQSAEVRSLDPVLKLLSYFNVTLG